MKKNKLQNELFKLGLIEEGNSEKIENFKKAYRSDYTKEYNKDFNARTKRKTLIFSFEEMEYLQEQADRYSMKLSPFIKAILFAYLNSSFVYPDQNKLTDIEKMLREINSIIGESVQYIHLSQNIKIEDIQSIKMNISALEKSLSNTIHNPPRLEEWLKSQIENDDMFLPRLLEAIAKYLTN